MNNLLGRIEVNPEIMLGKPVIKGTRVSVEIILKKLSRHISVKAILDDYPSLTDKDVKAAIAFASESLSTEEMFVLTGNK